MKYAHLKQIANYLLKFKKITSIKRVNDMLLQICFDKNMLFFDLAKSGSAIYKNDEFLLTKEYQAPFDNVLKKRLNNANLISVECLKNNRILKFTCEYLGSYKSLKSTLYLEFTGRFTNAIITDENGVILEALRHIDNSYRKIKVGEKLIELDDFEIKEKPVAEILDFDEFFKSEFKRINESNFLNLKSIKLSQNQKKIDITLLNLSELADKDKLLKSSDEYAKKADILLANLANLKEFERDFSLDDFNGNKIFFTLEDSPKNSANKFYTLAKRLKAKANGVEIERRGLVEKLTFFKNLQILIENAKSVAELEILLPKKQNFKDKKDKNENIRDFYIREFKISVGRNESGNIWLLKKSKKGDIWLHLKDLPSPHVIIKTNKLKLDDEILKFAAKLCLNFSNVGAGKYEIDYTKRENVKPQNGANVNYIEYKTIILLKQ